MAKKEARRTWIEHSLYMVAVSDARGGADSFVLDNIVHHAPPELMNVMRAKYDTTRSDYLPLSEVDALCTVDRAQQRHGQSRGCCGACRDEALYTRTCFRCGRTGNVESECKARISFNDEKSNLSGDMMLALTEKSSVDRTKRAKSKKEKKRGSYERRDRRRRFRASRKRCA